MRQVGQVGFTHSTHLTHLTFCATISFSMPSLSSVPDALTAFKSGQFLIVVDDEDRENEGDLVIAAEHIDEEKMAFMIRHTGGVVCMPMSNAIADQLHLPPMVASNTSRFGTAFTVSVEAAEGVTTGISAHDRAKTIIAAVNPIASPSDLRRPGHIFPLRAQDGGVLVRAGHTEATIDLCRLTGLREAGVLSELMHDNGTMMRLPDLLMFAHTQHLPIISITDLIAYRRRNESLVKLEAETMLETATGEWVLRVYRDIIEQADHVVFVKGSMDAKTPVLVRVHSECLTGDVFGSLHCDCGDQLHEAMRLIQEEGRGVILYLRQEGRGIGIANKVRAYELQTKEGLDTVEANERLGLPVDLREYGIGAQILRDIGVCEMRLMTNNPKKIVGLEGYGLQVTEQIPIETQAKSERQKKYLQTKKEKLGHLLRHI